VLQIAAVVCAAGAGFTIAGVAGFGGGVVTLPVLVWTFGLHQAIPILAICQLIGMASRVWINRREIDWAVVRMFASGSLPMAVLGSLFFIAADTALLIRILGGAMLVIVALTQSPGLQGGKMRLYGFPAVGASAGFLSAFLGIPGPFVAVFYLAYGLTPGAYIGTSSIGMGLIQIPKLIVFGNGGLLSVRVLALGLSLGAIAFVTSYFGHWLRQRVPTGLFPILINIMLVMFGLWFLIRG
jgi:uncharacterized membrane protein YfcA